MDPNANLREQRLIVAAVRYRREHPGERQDAARANIEDLARLCQLCDGLDDWLMKGGYLPDAWGQSKVRT